MFDSMPKLLERCGTSPRGTITGFYTILVDGDDLDEPVSDTVRGILDGHIVLSRNMAQRYHYPAIDILGSISRLATVVSGPETKKAVAVIRRLLADYAEKEDLINVGAYKPGSNPRIDEAIAKREEIEKFLIQAVDEKSTLEETLNAMGKIAGIEIPESEMEEYLTKMVLPVETEEEDETWPAESIKVFSLDDGHKELIVDNLSKNEPVIQKAAVLPEPVITAEPAASAETTASEETTASDEPAAPPDLPLMEF